MYINKLVYTFKQSKNYFKDKKKKNQLKTQNLLNVKVQAFTSNRTY
jgi:hypothetical protein